MPDVEITIIGAGVVGLAIARELSAYGDVLVIEQDISPGRGVSSRSSEVIHAGIYFPSHFLKTRLCVQGNPLLYEFCRRWHVPHRRIGKVIVAATSEEAASLEKLDALARDNGVTGLRLIDRFELKTLEPHVNGICALASPDTGIIDSHQLVKRLEALAIDNGARILCRTALVGLDQIRQGVACHVRQQGSSYRFTSRIVINAAGLSSDAVAAMAGIDIDAAGYRV
ncbi:MAG TPA: FAD-dependent oxidoreductase, partial [Deltaproteobacteria bacterium]|nr:FAD-dependent oxidoreductase [Deltaproteobacteria bacterium]